MTGLLVQCRARIASTVIILVALLCSRCGVPSYVDAMSLINDYPETGWRMFAAPTAGDPPGTVFAIDSDRVRKRITSLEGIVPVRREDVDLPEMKLQQGASATLGFAFNFIASGLPISGSQTSDWNKTVTVHLRLAGTHRSFCETSVISSALEHQSMLDGLTRRGDKIYVILETIDATEIEMRIESNDLGSASLDLDVSDLVHTTPQISSRLEPSSAYSITRKLDSPHRVLYLAYQLTEIRSGGGRYVLTPVPVSDLRSIVEESAGH